MSDRINVLSAYVIHHAQKLKYYINEIDKEIKKDVNITNVLGNINKMINTEEKLIPQEKQPNDNNNNGTIQCECGGCYTPKNKQIHQTTKKHTKFMESNFEDE